MTRQHEPAQLQILTSSLGDKIKAGKEQLDRMQLDAARRSTGHAAHITALKARICETNVSTNSILRCCGTDCLLQAKTAYVKKCTGNLRLIKARPVRDEETQKENILAGETLFAQNQVRGSPLLIRRVLTVSRQSSSRR